MKEPIDKRIDMVFVGTVEEIEAQIKSEPKDKRTKAYKEWKKGGLIEKIKESDAYKPQGLGDLLEAQFKKYGVKKIVDWLTRGEDCGCDGRRKWLNNFKPFKKNQVFEHMVESEREDWADFLKRHENTIVIDPKDIYKISRIHLRLFKRKLAYYTEEIQGCTGCNQKELFRAINRIHIVYETYK